MNGYRENNYSCRRNYKPRNDSYNMVPSDNISRPICTNAKLYQKLGDVEDLLLRLLSVSRGELTREPTLSRSVVDKRQNKVVQESTAYDEAQRFYKNQKLIDKYAMDNVLSEGEQTNGGIVGNQNTNNEKLLPKVIE